MALTTNWKLTLSYNGSGFHGWQVQSGLTTIQGTLSEALERLTGEKILPQGSGRTDAGVHALAQVCSFKLSSPVPPANLQRALNRILPAGIRVLSAEIVPPSFHARHSALSKTYEYRLFERRIRPAPGQPAIERLCSPFLAPFVWDCRWPLSLDRLQQAAALLLGTHDFTSMAATDPDRTQRDPDAERSLREPPSDNTQRDLASANATDPKTHRPAKINPIKTITESSWSLIALPPHSLDPKPWTLGPGPWTLTSETDRLLLFRITGNGFLHHMVRNLVGTLVEIGRSSLEVSDLPRILSARDRTAAGPTAPARGLYLVEVHYDTQPPFDNTSGCPTSRRDVGSQSSAENKSQDHKPSGSPVHAETAEAEP